jgi:hypothetical protein
MPIPLLAPNDLSPEDRMIYRRWVASVQGFQTWCWRNVGVYSSASRSRMMRF